MCIRAPCLCVHVCLPVEPEPNSCLYIGRQSGTEVSRYVFGRIFNVCVCAKERAWFFRFAVLGLSAFISESRGIALDPLSLDAVQAAPLVSSILESIFDS